MWISNDYAEPEVEVDAAGARGQVVAMCTVLHVPDPATARTRESICYADMPSKGAIYMYMKVQLSEGDVSSLATYDSKLRATDIALHDTAAHQHNIKRLVLLEGRNTNLTECHKSL